MYNSKHYITPQNSISSQLSITSQKKYATGTEREVVVLSSPPSMRTPFQIESSLREKNRSLLSSQMSQLSHGGIDNNMKNNVKCIPSRSARGKSEYMPQNIQYQLVENENQSKDFMNKFLIALPQELIKMKDTIQELDLSSNLFQHIPIELTQFDQLRKLTMNKNQIITIPHYIANMNSLEILQLKDNYIKLIPTSLCKMFNLRELVLCNNFIEELNQDLFNLSLTKLSLKCNSFTELPYTFYQILQHLICLELDWFSYAIPSIQSTMILSYSPQTTQKLNEIAKNHFITQQKITFENFIQGLSIKRINLCAVDQRGQTILFQMILNDSLGAIKYLCTKESEICYQADSDGVYPIGFATLYQKQKVFTVLLTFYSQFNPILNTFLLIAVKKSDFSMILQLIQKGVDVNFQCQSEIYGSLYGLNNKIKISKGSTCLHVAFTVFGRNANQQGIAANICNTLMTQGANPNIKNEEGYTPIHLAIKLPSLAVKIYSSYIYNQAVKWAVNYNITNFGKEESKLFNFNKRISVIKLSPLHIASNQGLVSILQMIATMDIDIFALNYQNRTAKFVAISSLQIIKLLRKFEKSFLHTKILDIKEDIDRTKVKNRNIIDLSSYIDEASISRPFEQLSSNRSSSRIREMENSSKVFLKDFNPQFVHLAQNYVKDDTDTLNNEEVQSSLNDTPNKIPQFQINDSNNSGKMKPLHQKFKFHLNLNKVNPQNNSKQIKSSNRSIKIVSSARQNLEELSVFYRQISYILRRKEDSQEILLDLLSLFSNQPLQFPQTLGFLSDRNAKEILEGPKAISVCMIISIIMILILIKENHQVKYTSSIISGSILLINQMKIKPTFQLPIFLLHFSNKIQYLKEYFNHLPNKFIKLEELDTAGLLTLKMMKFREQLSPNLCYDLSNPSTEEDQKKTNELHNIMITNLCLINVDYLGKKKENFNQLKEIFSNSNRFSILQYEALQIKQYMSTEFVTPKKNFPIQTTNENTWFDNLKQRLTPSRERQAQIMSEVRIIPKTTRENTKKHKDTMEDSQIFQKWDFDEQKGNLSERMQENLKNQLSVKFKDRLRVQSINHENKKLTREQVTVQLVSPQSQIIRQEFQTQILNRVKQENNKKLEIQTKQTQYSLKSTQFSSLPQMTTLSKQVLNQKYKK